MAINKPSVLIIYTGGTIGMLNDDESNALTPVNFYEIEQVVPEISRFNFNIRTITFDPPLDSADMSPAEWVKLVSIIEQNYEYFDGFVILHGTDTLAYTASALSFMCQNLHKPIICTGSQLPLGKLRTDGREHLLTAIEMAALKHDSQAMVPEVSIYFNGRLLRGNRARKVSSELFNAFRSGNYPPLADVGVHINFNKNIILKPCATTPTIFHKSIDPSVALLKIFPGISESVVDAFLNHPSCKAIVIESYGSGNVPSSSWFLQKIKESVKKGLIIVNVSQCIIGGVDMYQYRTSLCLQESGVICGRDITTEAALSKLMVLLGQNISNEEIKQQLNQSLRGEVSIY